MKKVKIYVAVTQTAHFVSMLVSILSMLAGNFDTSTWPFVYNMVMPFSTKPVLGWYLAWLIQLCIGMAYTTSMTSVVAYFVNSCIYVRAICHHFHLLIQSIEQIIIKNRDEHDAIKCEENYRKIEAKLRKAVQIQVNVIE